MWVVREQEGTSQALEHPLGMAVPRAWVLWVLYAADFLALAQSR